MLDEKVSAFDIKMALANMHANNWYFITECKNGASYVAKGELLIMDAVAIAKSWSKPQIRVYEIKTSRSDFLADNKYIRYMPYCHQFYFVVPHGMVRREEVEENIGLLYYNPETHKITTRRKAIHRDITPDPDLLMYVIMHRLDPDHAPFRGDKASTFAAWLAGKESNRELGFKVKSKLLADNVRLERELQDNERRRDRESELRDEIRDIKKVLVKHGIYDHYRYIEKLDAALSSGYPPEMQNIQASAKALSEQIDRIMAKSDGGSACSGSN